jgi:hypothetical protein
LFISPENPLRFEEIQTIPISEILQETIVVPSPSQKSQSANKTMESIDNASVLPSKKVKEKKKKPKKPDNPDDLLLGNDDEEQEEEESEDEDLPAYNLEDDESDLLPAKAPAYLEEVLSSLRSENPDVFELSLAKTKEILEKHPNDTCTI